MVEAALVIGVIGLCVASTYRPSAPELLHSLAVLGIRDPLVVSCGVLALCVLMSLGTGAAYHWALWVTLGRRQALPPHWWWAPTRGHPLLMPRERARVLPWFYAGAASFVGVVLAAGAVVWVAFSPGLMP